MRMPMIVPMRMAVRFSKFGWDPVTVALNPEDPMHQSLDHVNDKESGAEGELGKGESAGHQRIFTLYTYNFFQTLSDFRQHVNKNCGQKYTTSDTHKSGHKVLDPFHSAFFQQFDKN